MTPDLATVPVTDRLSAYLDVVQAEQPDVRERRDLFLLALLSGDLDGLDSIDADGGQLSVFDELAALDALDEADSPSPGLPVVVPFAVAPTSKRVPGGPR